MGCRDLVSGVSAPVYILVMLFAWSSWIDINGLFVEVPLLVNELPEGWNLPSYMAIIIQIANVGPIIYTIVNRTNQKKFKEWPAIYIIISIGAVSCILLAFLWDRTTNISGQTHSTALLSLTASLALVDCTSSVAFLPYMAQFRHQYMTAYYFGEGLSGLIPGLVGLIQGVGSDPDCINQTVITMNESTLINTTEYQIVAVYDPPRFAVRGFFIFLFCMIVVSGISFTLLHFLPYCKNEKTESSNSYSMENNGVVNAASEDIRFENIKSEKLPPTTPAPQLDFTEVDSNVNSTNGISSKTEPSLLEDVRHTSGPEAKQLSTCQFVFILILVAWVNAILNGVLPSTQSFTCLPYGNLAYTLAIRLATVFNPVMCIVAMFANTRSLTCVGILTFIGTVLTGYQLYLATMSPFPPLKHDPAGVALVILSSIIIAGAISFVKVTCALVLNDHGGKTGLLWCGGMTQVGSCIGAIVIFLVINIGNVFQSENACSSFVG